MVKKKKIVQHSSVKVHLLVLLGVFYLEAESMLQCVSTSWYACLHYSEPLDKYMYIHLYLKDLQDFKEKNLLTSKNMHGYQYEMLLS